METTAPGKTRLESLTGLRGVAAYSVLVAHGLDISFNYGSGPIFHAAASRLAYFGISLFFCLSGFVIYYNYSKSFASLRFGEATYRFFIARFARLYPLYALSILVSFRQPSDLLIGGDWITTLSFMTLTQSWFNREMAFFPPDWSISTEWFFYLAFIPLTFLVARIRRSIAVLSVVLIATPIFLVVSFRFQEWLIAGVTPWMWHGERVSAGIWGWISYFCPYIRVLEFIAGAIAAKAYISHVDYPAQPKTHQTIVALGLGWCISVMLLSPLTDGPAPLANLLSNFVFAPALVPLVLSCCRYPSWLSRVLASRPLVFMGDISYSVYIWSWFAMTFVSGYFVSHTPSVAANFVSWGKLAAIVALTTGIAVISYRWVETPTRRWIRLLMSPPVFAAVRAKPFASGG